MEVGGVVVAAEMAVGGSPGKKRPSQVDSARTSEDRSMTFPTNQREIDEKHAAGQAHKNPQK